MNATFLTAYPSAVSAVRFPARRESFPEKAICAYFRWLPVLWLCGLILPAAFLIFFGVFLFYVRTRRALLLALPWFAVGLSQYVSVLINWSQTSEPAPVLLKHLVAGYVSGWFLLGAAIGIGASGIVDPTRLLRSIVRITYYSIFLAVPAYALAFLLHRDSLFLVSPVGHLVPVNFASRNFAFGIFVYNWEDFLGSAFPRLSLLSPWPTAMGAAGVCMVFVAMNLKRKWERRWAIAGGVLMVIASMGRLAFLTLLICLLVRWFLNWKTPHRICAIWAALSFVILGFMLIRQPGALVNSLMNRFDETRAGASEVRNEVYEASWAGFHKAPIFGHGWPGAPIGGNDRVYGTEDGMDVGTHSTVSGLLYLGGLVNFSLFVFAFLFTLRKLVTQKYGALLKNNLMILLGIGFTCFGEGLPSLVLPMLFVFLWIGVSFCSAIDERNMQFSY